MVAPSRGKAITKQRRNEIIFGGLQQFITAKNVRSIRILDMLPVDVGLELFPYLYSVSSASSCVLYAH